MLHNVNSTIEINGTHLLAMSQSLMQTLTVNIPLHTNISKFMFIKMTFEKGMILGFFCYTYSIQNNLLWTVTIIYNEKWPDKAGGRTNQ